MTVRGPPGPPGPPGRGWLDTSFSSSPSSCGCNESLLRLYVKDLNPKLLPGPMGPPGTVGPVGPSGLPVSLPSTRHSAAFWCFRACWAPRAMRDLQGPEVSRGAKETWEPRGLRG